MNYKSKTKQTKILTCVALIIFCLIVCCVFVYSYVANYKQKKLDIKSRYTFSIKIDNNLNILKENETVANVTDNISDFSDIDMSKVGRLWLEQYIKQFRQAYVPYGKAVKKYDIDSIRVLDASNNTVLLTFWIIPNDSSSDYLSTWEGIMDDGRLKCEWVVSYYLDNNFDNSANIYVTSVMSSEDYGIKQYYASQGVDSGGDTEVISNSNKDQLANYVLKDNSLLVTYDGGERYVSVPVSYSYLLYEENSTSTLKDGSYMITTEKTAFVYGGKVANNMRVPITVIYSDDKGENWTTCELDDIYTADYYYVKFFDADNGVVVCGYGRSNDTNESSRIYKTSNGGESWDTVGSGPATSIIKGVAFASSDTGFFCYNYVEGMDSNLYKTDDGGKTFAKVMLDAQELDSSAANSQNQEKESAAKSEGVTAETSEQLKWNDVYKDALTPVIDTNGIITIYLTQGKNPVYNDGKTAAKYQSSDEGKTWKFIGQVEIKG